MPDIGARRLSPAVRRLARDFDLDPQSVVGTGKQGRVTRRNMLSALATKRAPQSTTELDRREELARITPMRRAIARHMALSLATSPHAWVLFEVDVTRLVEYRALLAKPFEAQHGVPLTYLPFVISIVCRCLKDHPRLNSSLRDGDLVKHQHINIGVAISVEAGLVVAAIPNADKLDITGLAKYLADVIDRSRTKRLRAEDVRGSTFTVNNSGVIGAVTSRPIINQPEAGIMTTQKIVTRAVVADNDAIVTRSMMNMALSFDHRILNLFEAGAFMADVKRRLETLSDADVVI